jgi:CRISPR-associated protein (TIGR02584 family)
MPAKTKSASANSATVSPRPQTVLIAVTGLSPAVLTETIWTLAKHPTEPVIPDKIIVLTTLTGERKIKEQLFGPDELWLTLRQQLLGKNHEADPRLDFADTPDRIRIFTRKTGGKRVQLDRMDTKEETEAVGDFLVEELWNWVGRPDTRVLASISGGFKTMSALLYAAMTVLGAPEDRILHVLVGEPYDGGTKPMFFWPKQPEQELKTTRLSKLDPVDTVVLAAKAKLVLTDVQFPPLRRLFGDYGYREAPTFSALVEDSRKAVVALAPPTVTSLVLHPATFTASVNDLPLGISKTEFCLLWFLADAALQDTQFDTAIECGDAYRDFLIDQKSRAPQSRRAFFDDRIKALSEVDGSRFTKTRSALKSKLLKAGVAGKALALHLPEGKHVLTLPLVIIRID